MTPLTLLEKQKAIFLAAEILTTLARQNETMTYLTFAEAVGIKSKDEKWHPAHRNLISALLYGVSALNRSLGSGPELDFSRIVSASTGEAGPGFHRTARIVVGKIAA